MFGIKKKKIETTTPIKSDEYLELRQLYDKLRVRVEGLVLDIDLYKAKLRSKKGLEDEKSDKNLNSGLLPDI